jgi:hypothetical protein
MAPPLPNPDDIPDMSLPENKQKPRLPNNIPDMSLSESTPKPPASSRPVPSSSPEKAPAGWKEGDRVLAPWEPHFLYVGTIEQIKGTQAMIQFADGDAGWVMVTQIRALAVQEGQTVLCRHRMGPHFFPAKILQVRGDEVLVGFEDDHDDEWTPIAALRIPCEPNGPPAEQMKVASHLGFLKNLRAGDRVWAIWQNSAFFPGTVDRLRNEEAHIRFDDGDHAWVRLDQLMPLDIPVGLRVMARWKMGGNFFPGTIIEVRGNRIHIAYDDGDKEWTTPAALALPLQPMAPGGSSGNGLKRVLGWLIPVGLLLFFFSRGCTGG